MEQAAIRTERSWITRILFATDFSPCARHAEKSAAFLSKAYGAAVDVVHVLEFYPGVYAAVQDHWETDGRLAEAVERLRLPTVSVAGHQRTGIPSVQICEVAMEHHADLIVIGTHGRTGLDHILLGSTAERVLTMAPCPVLTIRVSKDSEVRQDDAPITFKQIIVPIDFSHCSMDALVYAIQLAKDFGAALTLLHILEPAVYRDDGTLQQAAEEGRLDELIGRQLTPYVEAIQSTGISVRVAVRGGIPTDCILESVRASGTDLIVVGTHGRRGISHVMRGIVAEAVLRRSTCPLLVVKDLSCAPGHKRVVRLTMAPANPNS